MKLEFYKKSKIAQDTHSFYWKPEKAITWLPGQYFYFTLQELLYKDTRGPTRHFTISSSPTEKYIVFTTRTKKASGYKKSLLELKTGALIDAEGPTGTFILDEKLKGPHTLIAGGIGITPFRSQIKYAYDKGLSTKIHLIYSNPTKKDISFYKELQSWDKEMNNIKLNFTITNPENNKSSWKEEVGRIDKTMINKMVDNPNKNTFWLCGPPKMVNSMESSLIRLKIKPDRIRSEKFTGY